MNKIDPENEIIIIGSDHHNTLAIVRCFGKRKIPFIVVIHDDVKLSDEIMVRYSKYTKQLFIIKNNEEDMINWLLNNKNHVKKQVIIPCTDLAEYVIDKNFDRLNEFYLIPGFKDKPGMVCKLMNKFEQKKWSNQNNIHMAKSWNIQKNNNKYINLPEITFPCIIKPNISAFGNKNDIRICKNKEELYREIENFNNKNYSELIIQEFLKKEYEICALGCITEDKTYYGGIIKKIRENPPDGGGSLTFARFIDDQELKEKVDNVIKKIALEGYNGLYDIEFLVCEDDVYLNEINFRHSGNGYALLKSGIEAPYIWYLGKINRKLISNLAIKNKKIFFIDDFNELSLLGKKKISVILFIKDFLKSKSHSIFDWNDLGVFNYKIKKMIKDRRSKSETKK